MNEKIEIANRLLEEITPADFACYVTAVFFDSDTSEINPAHHDMINVLADLFGYDVLDLVRELSDYATNEAIMFSIVALCAACEFCDVHYQAWEICEDDDLECRSWE